MARHDTGTAVLLDRSERVRRRQHRTGWRRRGGRSAPLLEGAGTPAGSWDRRDRGRLHESETARAAAQGVGAVVHCAATAGPDLEAVRRVNTEGTRGIVEAALAAGVSRYVQISTISVYARPLESLDEEAPQDGGGTPTA